MEPYRTMTIYLTIHWKPGQDFFESWNRTYTVGMPATNSKAGGGGNDE